VQNTITAHQLKGAFNACVATHLKENLEKKKIPLNIAYNRNEEGKPIQRYPLVQFNSNKTTFEIVGIGKGDIIVNLWLNRILKENDFKINGKKVALLHPEKTTQYWYPQLLPQQRTYQLKGWKPFDTETLGDESRMDGIIWGNIHRMLSELGIKFTEKVNIRLQKLIKQKLSKGYHIDWITYDAVFNTNINLPQHIGIGHEPSIGSGKILKFKESY
jgi:hypothetical protein